MPETKIINKRVINFSAGPAVLPESVLAQIQVDLMNYQRSGLSVMEMSHRSSTFLDIFNKLFVCFSSGSSSTASITHVPESSSRR